MINITVTGTSLADCHSQIITMAEEVKAFQTSKESKLTIHVQDPAPVPSAVAPTLSEDEIAFKNRKHQVNPAADMPAPFKSIDEMLTKTGPDVAQDAVEVDKRGVPHLPEVHSANKEITTKGSWRKRRGVDDATLALTEAPFLKVAKMASTSTPKLNDIFAPPQQQAPPVAPPAPTTAHRQALPDAGSVLSEMNLSQPVMQQASPPPMVAPLTPPNTYDINSFRQNIVLILNKLADEGKIDHTWINQTKVQAFGGKDIFDWHTDLVASQMLFDTFVKYKFITAV